MALTEEWTFTAAATLVKPGDRSRMVTLRNFEKNPVWWGLNHFRKILCRSIQQLTWQQSPIRPVSPGVYPVMAFISWPLEVIPGVWWAHGNVAAFELVRASLTSLHMHVQRRQTAFRRETGEGSFKFKVNPNPGVSSKWEWSNFEPLSIACMQGCSIPIKLALLRLSYCNKFRLLFRWIQATWSNPLCSGMRYCGLTEQMLNFSEIKLYGTTVYFISPLVRIGFGCLCGRVKVENPSV